PSGHREGLAQAASLPFRCVHLSSPVVPKLFTVPYPFRHLISSCVGAEFSTDVTFSQWFFFLIMLVHCCDRCCVYKKEIQPCRTKYRGIWAILMHKMMFPSASCTSVSNGTFCEFRPFSVLGNVLPAYPLNHFAYPSLGTDALYVSLFSCHVQEL